MKLYITALTTLILSALAGSGCQHLDQERATVPQVSRQRQATIRLRAASSQDIELQGTYLCWIFPGEKALGSYTANGEYAFDCEGRIRDVMDYLAGKYQGKTQLGVSRVETEPPYLADRIVSFTWQCPVEIKLDDRIKAFAEAYHLDYRITPSGSTTDDGRKGVVVHLKTR